MYKAYIKRPLDILCSLGALLILSPVLLILTAVGAVAMGGNPFFVQRRPGKGGRIFSLIKFRTMNNRKDKQGNLLPDAQRLTGYGKLLRSTSLDELPELINVLLGDMSLVGPRPQLVRDMVFMDENQRRRHSVTPGLTGLAQVNGRNTISWEQKLAYDLIYIDSGITFLGDLQILLQTVGKVIKRSDTVREGTVSDLDFGDWLLEQGQITKADYEAGQQQAKALLLAPRPSLYCRYGKRCLDFALALAALLLLWPVLLILTLTGAVALGGNPFFVQQRPGRGEEIFSLIKFRTMNNRKDKYGGLLPDEDRLTPYGKLLRATSLDELPELINILKGELSFVGPRPLLVEYLPLYSPTQRKRHSVPPGLTGYAQVNGRNALSWEKRFALDVWYTEHVSMLLDVQILLRTVGCVFSRKGISSDTSATMEPFTGSKEEVV